MLATAGSGWFQNTETGFELGADDWHEWCTWALQAMIALHLCAIVYTSWRQRSNLVTRMLPRRRSHARSAAGTQRLNACGPLRGPCVSLIARASLPSIPPAPPIGSWFPRGS